MSDCLSFIHTVHTLRLFVITTPFIKHITEIYIFAHTEYNSMYHRDEVSISLQIERP